MKICREKSNLIKIQQEVSVTLHEHLLIFYFCHEIFCVTINICVLLRVTRSSAIHTKNFLPSNGNNDYANRESVTLYVQTLPKLLKWDF